MEKIKRFIRDNEPIMYVVSFVFRIFMSNKIRGKKNIDINLRGAFVKKTKVLNNGKNNSLKIEKGCRIANCNFMFFGNDNEVIISNDCVLNNVEIWISDGSIVKIGHNSHFVGPVHIACIEKTRVDIGKKCLFSSDITFRTGDSHSILDLNGKRINKSSSIYIGNHVWIGNQVVVLKNANIGDDCVIGTRSLITGKIFQKNCVIAGSPAKVIKEGTNWDHRLL